MRSDYFQVRYIGVAEGGRELIRIDRVDGLLTLSRSTQGVLPRDAVDLSGLAVRMNWPARNPDGRWYGRWSPDASPKAMATCRKR